MKTKPIVCTKEDPWTPDKGTPVQHVDIEEIKAVDCFPGGVVVTYKCLACGHIFTEELPQ